VQRRSVDGAGSSDAGREGIQNGEGTLGGRDSRRTGAGSILSRAADPASGQAGYRPAIPSKPPRPQGLRSRKGGSPGKRRMTGIPFRNQEYREQTAERLRRSQTNDRVLSAINELMLNHLEYLTGIRLAQPQRTTSTTGQHTRYRDGRCQASYVMDSPRGCDRIPPSIGRKP